MVRGVHDVRVVQLAQLRQRVHKGGHHVVDGQQRFQSLVHKQTNLERRKGTGLPHVPADMLPVHKRLAVLLLCRPHLGLVLDQKVLGWGAGEEEEEEEEEEQDDDDQDDDDNEEEEE